MIWSQVYDPFQNMFLSTLAAAVPVVVLLGLLAFHVRAHIAAFIGLLALSIAYSAPPRFKGRPGLDSLANVLYAGSLLVSVLANGITPTQWAAVGAFALWAIASHAFTAIQDLPADAAAGIRDRAPGDSGLVESASKRRHAREPNGTHGRRHRAIGKYGPQRR